MNKTDYEAMFKSAVHIGHRKQKWNPKMKKFIFGERNGIHLIDLEKTASYLEEALTFLSKLVSEGRKVLFVSTKPQSIRLVEQCAKDSGMPYVVNKWIPGFLTNYSTIKTRIKYLLTLEEQEASGEFDKYTKKEVAKLKKTMEQLESSLGGVKHMDKKPDAVFVIDPIRDNIVVEEANKLGIPIVSIADTNADPDLITYPIPANDDAIKSLKYLLTAVVDSIKKSTKSKK
ncbi:30S ribosomal protein S2 [Patescibacteria group bacterium]|nr:30S ribosomal protein S2 [Patescibacteria group bacterium]